MREVFRSPDGSYRQSLRDEDDEEQRSYLEHAAGFHSPKVKFALRMLDEVTCSYSEEKRESLGTT